MVYGFSNFYLLTSTSVIIDYQQSYSIFRVILEMNSYDINSKQIYFYVVQDQQVVGRYFSNISGAINHIQKYSSFQKEKRPKDLMDESGCIKLNNRAVIPVHNCIALHPHSIEGIPIPKRSLLLGE